MIEGKKGNILGLELAVEEGDEVGVTNSVTVSEVVSSSDFVFVAEEFAALVGVG